MGLSPKEAALLLFMDVETLRKRDRLDNDDPKLQCVMNYQEIMAQPNIDRAREVMGRHYRQNLKTRGDHWE